jgi:hypothetical protein
MKEKSYIQTHSLEEARLIAETAAKKTLASCVNQNCSNLLEENVFEAEFCWFFFRNRMIICPPETSLAWSWAFAVSKRGELRSIADFYEEPEKLYEYLEVMSKHFKEKGI